MVGMLERTYVSHTYNFIIIIFFLTSLVEGTGLRHSLLYIDFHIVHFFVVVIINEGI